MGFRKRITINLLATWGDHVIGLAIGLILMPFVLGSLGDTQYGLWVLINSVAGYSGLLNLGLGATVSRYVATYHAQGDSERVNRVVNVIGAVYLIMGLIALLIAGAVAWAVPTLWPSVAVSTTELRWVIMILGLSVVASITGSVFGGVLIGVQRFDLERGICLVSGLVRFGLTLAFLQQQSGLLILASVFFATTVVENLGLFIAAFRQLPELRLGVRFLDRQTLRECLNFSAFALLEMMAAKLIESSDCIVIGCWFGANAIVPYYVALRLCQFITKPLAFIGQVCLPRAGELHANGEITELRQLLIRAFGLSFLLTMGFFIGASYFGPTLIETWVHKPYPQSQQLLMVLLFGQLVATPMRVVIGVLFGIGDVRKPAVTYVIEALANFALSLALISQFGLLGVALGTLIPLYLVELGILLPHALQRLQLDSRRLLTEAIGPQLFPLVALVGYSYSISSHVELAPGWPLMLLIASGGATVLGTTWLGQQKLVNWYRSVPLEVNPVVQHSGGGPG